MVTSEPRAATGTLDELLPVAAFTSPLGEIDGVCAWSVNHTAKGSRYIGRIFRKLKIFSGETRAKAIKVGSGQARGIFSEDLAG